MTSKRIQAKTETPRELYDAAWSLRIVTQTHYMLKLLYAKYRSARNLIMT